MIQEERDAHGHEAHLPATHPSSGEGSWLPAAHVDARRAPGVEGTAAARAQAADDGVAVERARRLRKGPEFDRVYREGTVIGGPLLVIRHLPNALGHARWGFAVGKRLERRAVVRNRVRRRLRDVARAAPVGAYDIVVTARAGALAAHRDVLAHALAVAVRRAGIESHE